MKELILKWALKNAIDHDGKAQAGAVIPKVIGEKPELKEKIKDVAKEAALAVKEVNKLSLEEQKSKLQKIAPELLEVRKHEEKHEIPDLPGAETGKVVMLFPPEPSKYATIGHAKASLLNYLCSQKYKGKFLIRFEDTNANKIKKEYYDEMLKDLAWLGEKWDKVDYESDHVDEFYVYAEKLIKKGNAYMCNCETETIHKLRGEGKACKCRDRKPEENLKLWKQMLDNKFKEGEYSLRAKIDMKHKNTTMRDPTIMRVLIGTHPRVGDKYFVWPTYDFATAVMDDIEGITHRMRSKEFEMRAALQQWLQKELGIKSPFVIEFARSNLEGIPSSGRIIREKLANGNLLGWDDPRLPTLIALRRRGFLPEAIKNFVVNIGITKTEATISRAILEAENRKLLDPITKRYFFVPNPIKLKVENAPEVDAELKYHPENDFGSRQIKTHGVFMIPKDDLDKMRKSEIFRLKDLYNVKITKKTKSEANAEYAGKEMIEGTKKIQWATEENVPVDVLVAGLENLDTVKGVAESSAINIKIGEVVQLERFGFARLDSKEKILKFIFTHK